MDKLLFQAIINIVLILFCCNTGFTQDLSILYTNNYPPLSIIRGDDGSGLGCDLVKEINKRNGTNIKINFGKWNIVYEQTQQEKNSGIFPALLTDNRNVNFSWVGPFCISEYYVYMSNTKNKTISSKEDLKNVKSIATYKGYALNEALIKQGCKNLVYFNSPKKAIISVILGKSDACIFPTFIIDTFHKESGYIVKSAPDPVQHTNGIASLVRGDNGVQLTYGTGYESYNDITLKHKNLGHQNKLGLNGRPDVTPVLSYHKENVYFALNSSIPAKTVEMLQKTLYNISQDGTLKKLFYKYHIPLSMMPKVPPTPNISSPQTTTSSAIKPTKTTNNPEKGAHPLTLYAENFPPLTFSAKDSKSPQGAVVDLISAIEKELKIKSTPILIDDWNKIFDIVKSTPYSVVCTLKRIPERENEFYWIGPYASDSAWLYSRRDFEEEIKNIDEAKLISQIACIDKTFAHETLLKEGFKNITAYSKPDDAVHDMLKDSEHAAAFSSVSAPYIIRNAGYSPINIKPLIKLSKKTNYYIGISKSTPKAVALAWQEAFKKIKKRGDLMQIIKHWIK